MFHSILLFKRRSVLGMIAGHIKVSQKPAAYTATRSPIYFTVVFERQQFHSSLPTSSFSPCSTVCCIATHRCIPRTAVVEFTTIDLDHLSAGRSEGAIDAETT